MTKASKQPTIATFFLRVEIFFARKCREIKNMSIFAVPNERFFVREIGEMPEWSIGPHSKCGVRATVPGVRIPLSPPNEAEYQLTTPTTPNFTLYVRLGVFFYFPPLCEGTRQQLPQASNSQDSFLSAAADITRPSDRCGRARIIQSSGLPDGLWERNAYRFHGSRHGRRSHRSASVRSSRCLCRRPESAAGPAPVRTPA